MINVASGVIVYVVVIDWLFIVIVYDIVIDAAILMPFVTWCPFFAFLHCFSILLFFPSFLSRATRPISRCVCRSVGWSVGHAFTFSMRMAFIAPAQLITVPT